MKIDERLDEILDEIYSVSQYVKGHLEELIKDKQEYYEQRPNRYLQQEITKLKNIKSFAIQGFKMAKTEILQLVGMNLSLSSKLREERQTNIEELFQSYDIAELEQKLQTKIENLKED